MPEPAIGGGIELAPEGGRPHEGDIQAAAKRGGRLAGLQHHEFLMMGGHVHARMRGGVQADDVFEVVAGRWSKPRDQLVQRGQEGVVELVELILEDGAEVGHEDADRHPVLGLALKQLAPGPVAQRVDTRGLRLRQLQRRIEHPRREE